MWAGEEHLQAVITAISSVSTRGDREWSGMKTRLSVRFLKELNLRGEKNWMRVYRGAHQLGPGSKVRR